MDPANLGTLLDWYDGIAVDRRLTADDHLIDGAVVYRVAVRGSEWTDLAGQVVGPGRSAGPCPPGHLVWGPV